jgi:hypothetical protein
MGGEARRRAGEGRAAQHAQDPDDGQHFRLPLSQFSYAPGLAAVAYRQTSQIARFFRIISNSALRAGKVNQTLSYSSPSR